ncbi:MAG: HipA domain-containing protein [Gammaproteobacteria bacterium]|nr:HipA domain-containing protein [Gammaproteobacteria bacterium]
MARNCDDHTKNFAFLLPEGGRWQLAAAYDGITADELLRLADRHGIGPAREVIGEVTAAIGKCPIFAREAGLSPAETSRISGVHHRLN